MWNLLTFVVYRVSCLDSSSSFTNIHETPYTITTYPHHTINHTMAPLHEPHHMLTPRFLHTRSDSCDANYTPSCSTHRIVLLIIIILVGAFVGIILSLVYARNWTRNNINNTRQYALRADSQPPSGFDLLRHEHRVLATMRFPQGRVINGRGVGEQSWRKWDEGGAAASFEAPPPYMPRMPDAARVVA